MIKAIGTALMVIGTCTAAAPASAQDLFGPISGGVGYQLTNRSIAGSDSVTFPLGFDVFVGAPMTSSPWGINADLSWNRHTDSSNGADVVDSILGIGAGPTYRPASTDSVVLQALIGIDHESFSLGTVTSSSNAMMVQPGVIFMFPISDYHAFAGVHFRHVFGDQSANAFVFNVGIEFVPRK
ncbi:MAG TPA: outer membrane beta-barrel protein [Vicinamibacterales bacterium]|nr:outer membrane beta-barrel protein [Vicinamibacterales bacterium]